MSGSCLYESMYVLMRSVATSSCVGPSADCDPWRSVTTKRFSP